MKLFKGKNKLFPNAIDFDQIVFESSDYNNKWDRLTLYPDNVTSLVFDNCNNLNDIDIKNLKFRNLKQLIVTGARPPLKTIIAIIKASPNLREFEYKNIIADEKDLAELNRIINERNKLNIQIASSSQDAAALIVSTQHLSDGEEEFDSDDSSILSDESSEVSEFDDTLEDDDNSFDYEDEASRKSANSSSSYHDSIHEDEDEDDAPTEDEDSSQRDTSNTSDDSPATPKRTIEDVQTDVLEAAKQYFSKIRAQVCEPQIQNEVVTLTNTQNTPLLEAGIDRVKVLPSLLRAKGTVEGKALLIIQSLGFTAEKPDNIDDWPEKLHFKGQNSRNQALCNAIEEIYQQLKYDLQRGFEVTFR